MKLSRVIDESSIDYPGKFGPVVFVSGCNFKCGFCHNPDLINFSSEGIDVGEFIEDLKKRVESGWVNGICITGGEPTLNLELLDFLTDLRKININIKLDTNGSNPTVLGEILEKNLVDYIALDVKSDKDNYEKFTGVKGDLNKIEESIRLISESKIDFEFRTTLALVLEKEIRWLNKKEIGNMMNWILSLVSEEREKKIKWNIQKFYSRNKGDILSERFSKEKLPKEFHETPKEELEKAKKILGKYFNCEIV